MKKAAFIWRARTRTGWAKARPVASGESPVKPPHSTTRPFLLAWAGILSICFRGALFDCFVHVWNGTACCTPRRCFIKPGSESPTFAPGNLAGQDNWVAGVSASQSAAQIIATNGGQEVQISGPQVAQTSPTLYNSTFSRTLTNYDPVVSGTPIVDPSADLWQQQGATTSQAPPINPAF